MIATFNCSHYFCIAFFAAYKLSLLNSCATIAYQVLETKSNDVKSNVFANQDVEIRYNFWSVGGAMNFRICIYPRNLFM